MCLYHESACSDTVDLDFFLGSDAFLNEEKRNVLPEVSLQLDNHALLLVFDDGTIAMEHFLEGSEEFFVIQVIGKTLDDSDALTGGTLLVVQIYFVKDIKEIS